MWARVASTIRPLSRDVQSSPELPDELPKPVHRPVRPRSAPSPLRSAKESKPRPLGAATLDGGWDRRLSSGSVEPDRVLDLHGMNLDSAWRSIDGALEQAIARGDRLVLLVTGHHRPGDAPVQRGRIRAAVHDWLAASRHASKIAAVRGAHRRHGGGGSLYIVLRRHAR